jgi:hypothetical protein
VIKFNLMAFMVSVVMFLFIYYGIFLVTGIYLDFKQCIGLVMIYVGLVTTVRCEGE